MYDDLREVVDHRNVVDPDKAEVLLEDLDRLKRSKYQSELSSFETFLPPRLVQAGKKGRCVPFFGAGVSAEAGIPLWWDLLSKLGIESEFVNEPELEHDPLTAAEVLANRIGMPILDNALRAAVSRAKTPTLAHFLLAALDQDVYVTTNYDSLFEIAWEHLYKVRPRVITTDADVAAHLTGEPFEKDEGKPLVFKLHGSVDRQAEELILTRGQYRRHYRSNKEIFKGVRDCLGRAKTLFVGFGHRDPEITRLVEDVIHAFETRGSTSSEDLPPAFYSLQFNMGEQTPEIFAARGIVALRPALTLHSPESIDPRSSALVRSQFDFLGALGSDAHAQLDLDLPLSHALDRLHGDLDKAMEVLEGLASELVGSSLEVADGRLQVACEELGDLAGQGVYLLRADDRIVDVGLPPGLVNPDREAKDLHQRSYVKQARMYREPFISSTLESVFNGNSTAFLCVPILDSDSTYRGLVFSAFQVGAWRTPLEIRDDLRGSWGERLSFILIDSDGVLLLPPNGEFEPVGAEVDEEKAEDNVGFEFESLLRLSRRDKLVERVWNNIVPLARDDDVLQLGDVEMYSVVADIPRTRWKLALSVPTP